MNASLKQRYGRYKQYSTNLAKYYRVPSIQISLSIVLSIFVCAFFVLVAIRPALIAITELKQNITESEKTLKQLQTKTAALQKASKLWEEIELKQTQIDASFPSDGPNYQTIAEAVEVLANESGVVISSESLGSALTYSSIIDPYVGKERTMIEMPFSVRVKGGYLEITSFLEQILSMRRVLGVESISFEKDIAKENLGLSLSLNISGQFHYLANEEQLKNILDK
ncbi:MAG: type 4a pilus biogenesis protein PilO [bacterium]